MSAARRDRGGRRGFRGRPDGFNPQRGGAQPGRFERGQSTPQFAEELARQASKMAVQDILKSEPPENTIGRLRSLGLNNKIAAAVYAHARDQVKIIKRRIVAILMLLGAVLLLTGLTIAAVQNWPGTGKPWHLPWVGLIFSVIGIALAIWSNLRWRALIRAR